MVMGANLRLGRTWRLPPDPVLPYANAVPSMRWFQYRGRNPAPCCKG